MSLDSYWLANFRAGITNPQWDVIAYVDNAFDDDTIKSGLDQIDLRYLAANFAGPFALVIPNSARGLLPDQRQVGLRVNYRFGE